MSVAQEFRQPATYKITVNGNEITDLCPYLVDAKVETSRSAPSVCTLTFDTIRLDDCTWIVQDAGIFEPWNEFKIEADFGDYDEEIMRGFVKTVKADTPEQMGEAKVTVTCQDETMLLDREHTRKTRSREDEPMTDGEIAQEIAGENNLSVEAEDGLSNISLIPVRESFSSSRRNWMRIPSRRSWCMRGREPTAYVFRSRMTGTVRTKSGLCVRRKPERKWSRKR